MHEKDFQGDLHVHSSHSNKPSLWALRQFNCPENCTTPEFIYDTALKKGMDYVTITDHNTINGSVGLPIPEDAILLFCGFLISRDLVATAPRF